MPLTAKIVPSKLGFAKEDLLMTIVPVVILLMKAPSESTFGLQSCLVLYCGTSNVQNCDVVEREDRKIVV